MLTFESATMLIRHMMTLHHTIYISKGRS